MTFSNPQGHPFERILAELGKLVQVAKKCSELPPDKEIPPELFAKVEHLEQEVREFTEINNEILKRNTKADQPRQMAMLEGAPPLSKKDTRIVNRLEAYKDELLALQSSVQSQMKKKDVTGKEISVEQKTQEDDKEKAKAEDVKVVNENRKNKFRSLGGKQRWLPL